MVKRRGVKRATGYAVRGRFIVSAPTKKAAVAKEIRIAKRPGISLVATSIRKF